MLCFAAWTGFGLLRLASWRAAQPLDLPGSLFVLGRCWLWAAMTPAIVALSRALPWTPRRAPRIIAAHLVAAGAAALLDTTFFRAGRVLLWPAIPLRPFANRLVFDLDLNVSIYLAIAVCAYAARHRALLATRAEAALRAAGAATRARLDLLARKLHPHFLFNTLNSIAELLHDDAAAARRTLDDLRALLAATLRARDAEVPLDTELRLLERYLAIQRTRFRERLQVELAIAGGARRLLVPHLFLQPLVENAVRHGVGRRGDVRLRVAARVAGDHLELSVRDAGPGFARALDEGLGLRNTRARLAALGAGARLELRGGPDGAEVIARLPARAATTGPATGVLAVEPLPPAVRRGWAIAAIAGGWLLLAGSWLALRFARVAMNGTGVAPDALLRLGAATVAVYVVATLPVIAAARRWPLSRRSAALHAGLAAATVAGFALARPLLLEGELAPLFTAAFASELPYELAVYVVVVGLAHGSLYLGAARRRALEAARLEAEAAEAELAARRLRLEPEWLDGELAAIAALAAVDPQRADDRTAALGARLRAMLDKEQPG